MASTTPAPALGTAAAAAAAPAAPAAGTTPLSGITQKPKTIAQTARSTTFTLEEEKYQRKYHELKKRLCEMEQDNDRIVSKITRARRNIERMQVERTYEYLILMEHADRRQIHALTNSASSEVPPPNGPMGASQHLRELLSTHPQGTTVQTHPQYSNGSPQVGHQQQYRHPQQSHQQLAPRPPHPSQQQQNGSASMPPLELVTMRSAAPALHSASAGLHSETSAAAYRTHGYAEQEHDIEVDDHDELMDDEPAGGGDTQTLPHYASSPMHNHGQSPHLAPPRRSLTAAERRRNARRDRDPNAPKRPSNAFLYFYNLRRSELRANQPDLQTREVAKIISDGWKTMTPEQKQPYWDMHERDKLRFEAEMISYASKKAGDMTSSPSPTRSAASTLDPASSSQASETQPAAPQDPPLPSDMSSDVDMAPGDASSSTGESGDDDM
ncbi:non-histone protein [Sorochytrium milnesiophthora]